MLEPREILDESHPMNGAAAPIASIPQQRISVREILPGLPGVISVTGSGSNAGKTWLVEEIVRALATGDRTSTALKVTRTHVDTCPRENDACGVCEDLETPWRIVTDPKELDVPRKDTGRYMGAGADSVLWLLAQPAHMPGAITAVLPLVRRESVLVAEGNSFRDYVNDCDITLMVVTAPLDLKPSAYHVMDRVDALVCRREEIALVEEAIASNQVARCPVIASEEAASWVLTTLDEVALRANPPRDKLHEPGSEA